MEVLIFCVAIILVSCAASSGDAGSSLQQIANCEGINDGKEWIKLLQSSRKRCVHEHGLNTHGEPLIVSSSDVNLNGWCDSGVCLACVDEVVELAEHHARFAIEEAKHRQLFCVNGVVFATAITLLQAPAVRYDAQFRAQVSAMLREYSIVQCICFAITSSICLCGNYLPSKPTAFGCIFNRILSLRKSLV